MPVSRIAPTPIEATVTQRIRRSPTEKALFSSERNFALSPCAPQTSRKMLCSRKLNANVVTSSVAGEALRKGRRPNSVASEKRITVDDQDDDPHGNRLAQRNDQRVGARGEELALREVDEAHDPEDQADPHRDEREDRAERHRVDDRLERVHPLK